MGIRGIDTQMLATKPMDMQAAQAKINKANETQMAQNATVMNRDNDRDAERTVRAEKSEQQRIGTEERERGNSPNSEGGGKDEPEREEAEKWVDPMLSLPVEKGKFAKPQKHFINVEV